MKEYRRANTYGRTVRLLQRFMILLIAAIVCIPAMSGCGRDSSAGGSLGASGNGHGKGLTVVTSFYPVYISTINITKGISGVRVLNMTRPQTGCLHDYSLKPDDMKTLESADIFVISGAGMETFLGDVIKQQRSLSIIDSSKGIALIKDGNGTCNPHYWVSISDDIKQVENIADQLAAKDEKHASRYRANAESYKNKLEALKAEMHNVLDGTRKKDIITFHEAFPYFASEFGLDIKAVIEREPGTEPSPRELGDCIDIIERSGIKALFVEPQYPSRAADAIARETGAGVYTLDPVVTGDTGPDAFNAYIKAMEQNLKTLEGALK